MLTFEAPTFKNIDVYGSVIDNIQMGSSHYYSIDALDSFFDQLDSIQIELTSYLGDTDLEVTLDGQQFTSMSQLPFDQVTLKD